MKNHEEIDEKLENVRHGDINLDGEGEDYKAGFIAGLEWILNG